MWSSRVCVVIYYVRVCLDGRGVFWGREGVRFHACLHEPIVFSWSTKHVLFPVIEWVCVFIQVWLSAGDKATGSGCVWRWRTSPQGVLFLVFHAHGQWCPLWDLWRERRRRRKRKGGGKRGKTREDRGHGVRGELGCTRAASLSMPSRGGWGCVCVVLRGAYVCMYACVLALRA